jgi:transposase
VVLDDLVSADHMCRVIEAFVEQLDMEQLGFGRAQPADTGRPGYNPRALLEVVPIRISAPASLISTA